MRRAIEEGLVDVDHSIEIGLRGSLYGPEDWTGLRDELGLDYLTTEQIFELGADAVAARIRERVGDRPAFISFDIDVVDPAHAPGTGTPEAGGPSAREMLAIVRALRGIDFVGFDVVEVIPAYDPAGQTATLAANLAYEMLSLVALRRSEPMTESWRDPMPPGFRWPDGYRAAACFTFDADAESPILFEHPEAADWLDVMTHQAYGARAGIARILRVLDRQQVRATFFIPGYTAERAPAICRAIRDAGHEIAHHGYLHEGAHGASADEQERRILRGLASLDEVLGVRPTGYRGPNWELTYETPGLLARHGFTYDSGLMDADHPYVLATSAEPGRADDRRAAGALGARRLGALQLPAGDHGVRRDREPGRGPRALDARARGARRGRRPVHAHEPPVRLGAGVPRGRAGAADRTGEGDRRPVDRDGRRDRRRTRRRSAWSPSSIAGRSLPGLASLARPVQRPGVRHSGALAPSSLNARRDQPIQPES